MGIMCTDFYLVLIILKKKFSCDLYNIQVISENYTLWTKKMCASWFFTKMYLSFLRIIKVNNSTYV